MEMKKSRPRSRSRSGHGAAKTAVTEGQVLDPRANADLQLSAALQSFEALTVAQQLQFLAVVLRDEIGRKADVQPQLSEPSPDPPAQEMLAAQMRAPEVPVPEDPASVLAASPMAVPEQSGAEPPATPILPVTPNLPPTPALPVAAGVAKLQINDGQESAQYGRFEVHDLGVADMRPAGFPTASIIMTMVCSFVLAFAVMLWHRQSAASASQDPSPLQPAMPVAAAPGIRLAAAPAIRPAAAPSQPLAPPPPAPVNAQGDRREAPIDLPVELSFRRRPTGTDGEHFGRISWHVTGRIHNLSDEALTVDVTVEGEQGPSSTQVSLDPDGDAEFGSNDGVEIHPNDRVTLHSAPYGDAVSRVR